MQLVAVLNGRNSLFEDLSDQPFLNTVGVFHDEVVQVPAVPEFLDQVQFCLCVDHLVQANDARVGHEFHAAHFLVQVCLRDLVQLRFVYYLDGHTETWETEYVRVIPNMFTSDDRDTNGV